MSPFHLSPAHWLFSLTNPKDLGSDEITCECEWPLILPSLSGLGNFHTGLSSTGVEVMCGLCEAGECCGSL